MKEFTVLYRDSDALPAEPPLAFTCMADDGDHAQEQCENSYPGCDVLWIWQGNVKDAYSDYWGYL